MSDRDDVVATDLSQLEQRVYAFYAGNKKEMSNNPFSPDYKPQLNWGAQNLDKQRGDTVTKNLEKARLKNPAHDLKIGLTLNERISLLPRQFHVFSKAVPGKK